MIPTVPLRLRNRLAETVLTAVHDAEARQRLHALADDAAALEAWLAPDERGHAALVRRRAQAAKAALAPLPLGSPSPSLDDALVAAAALFDAGLGYEVHELLEVHWTRAAGDEREVLQGLIQIAVGYQHRANGNRAGARALLEEGAARIDGHHFRDLAVLPFARAVAAAAFDESAAIPRFPRATSPPAASRRPAGRHEGGH